jgi:sialate O-acetylesterase
MVIQQRSTFKISGKGTPNQDILVHCSWEEETYNDTTTVLTDGTWTQIVTTPSGSYTHRTITVKGKSKELTFTNILIGEVWLCAGQSNMWFPVKNLENADDVKVDAEYFPNIRLYEYPFGYLRFVFISNTGYK